VFEEDAILAVVVLSGKALMAALCPNEYLVCKVSNFINLACGFRVRQASLEACLALTRAGVSRSGITLGRDEGELDVNFTLHLLLSIYQNLLLS
jgi:hypothetical protein